MKRILAWMLVLALLLPMGAALGEEIWRRGDQGDRIREIQNRLIELKYLEGEATGVFDEATEEALIAFQRRNTLLATGMADAKTLEVLFSAEAASLAFDIWEEEVCEEDGAVANAYFMPGMWPSSTSTPMAAAYSAPAAKGMAWESEGWNTDEYAFFQENGFQSTAANPLSTFAADVDTASYAQLRRMILSGAKVPADAVRVEEMLNYFRYNYNAPQAGHPLGVTMELAPCPWNPEALLLQIGVQAEEIKKEDRAPRNLVFLIDVSGSMFGSDRLDLVKRAFLLLLEELDEKDTVSIVTYASSDRVVLSGVPASEKTRIMEAISALEAGGSTNSAAGITTAYALAEQYASEGSVNRILMATDGDFNVGMTSEGDLARLVMEKKTAGVRLTMLGVGYGNYKDNKLEALADYGDGNYYYLDSIFEARRALVQEAGGTLTEVAKDVKLQVDFNPAMVAAYRLIGYEDRVVDARDFADDTKDGGEIGSGHRVTALYEIVPVGSNMDLGLPQSKYTQPAAPAANAAEGEWLTLNIRYKAPDGDTSTLETFPLSGDPADALSDNMKWAAAVAECAMLLRESEYAGASSWESALSLARDCGMVTGDPYREEFVYMLTLLERAAQ